MKSFRLIGPLIFIAAPTFASPAPREEPLFRTSAHWSPPLSSDTAGSRVSGNAEFVKISWFFPNRVRVSKVELESCDRPFNDGVDVYVDFERRHLYVEGGKKSLSADLGFISPDGESVRSLTVNFRHNSSLCLRGARILGVGGRPLAGLPRAAVAASIPEEAFDLFDAKFDTVWQPPSTGPDGSFQPLTFQLTTAQSISRAHVWNGDQSSKIAFRDKGRVERLSLKMGSGPAEVFELKDSTGVQELKLRNGSPGTQMQIQVLAAKKGARDPRPSLSEIRFSGPEGPVYVSEEPSRTRIENEIRKVFGDNELVNILDQELESGEGKERWSFRFRSNGEFYVRGFSDEWHTTRAFFAVGTYRAESLPKTNEKKPRSRIILRLSGFRRVSPNAPDADLCEIACGAEESRSSLPVRDVLVIESLGKGLFYVRNRSEDLARDLVFGDMRARITSLKE